MEITFFTLMLRLEFITRLMEEKVALEGMTISNFH
jgi:hypothetical protein